VNRIVRALALPLLLCIGTNAFALEQLPPGTIQQGSLANPKLIRDTMLGAAAKAGGLGCKKIDSVKPYVTALPEGAPGSRVWGERWIFGCAGKTYPVNIRFNESGMDSADYQIR
jgi:hypothetical protein